MTNKPISQEAETNQENDKTMEPTILRGDKQKLIKHFEVGVVNYSLFHAFWEEQDLLIRKIKYLLNTDEGDWGITIALDLIRAAQKEVKEYWERAGQVKDEAGGNDVYVVPASEYSEFQQLKMKSLEKKLGINNGLSQVHAE